MYKKLILSLLLLVSLPYFSDAQSERHVLLITIDGFRPDFYLDPSWNVVNLRHIMEQGAYATEVQSVFPSVTYPSHTSILTGAYPARHGILFNKPPDAEHGEWNYYFKKIRQPTLWQAAHDQGLTVASVYWPVSVGAPVDHLIPVIRPEGTSMDRREIVRVNSRPEGLLEELEKEATGNLSADELQSDDNTARMGAYILKKYKPNFMTLHLVDVDHQEHAYGRDAFEVRRTVASADHAVGVLLQALQDAGLEGSTTVIITGDHGFVNKHSLLTPNVWLKEAGITAARFYSAGGSAFLIPEDPKDKKNLARAKQVLQELPAKYRRLFRVIDKAGLDAIGANPDAILALAANPGIAFGDQSEGPALRPTHGGGHGYFPDFHEIMTGFVACGPGIRKGTNIPYMSVVDMAPLVAALLDIDFDAPDGQLYPGLLQSPK